MFCDVSAYDDRQKAKRESIISRPLFSSSDKSASLTPASAAIASSSSSLSSSSPSKSAAVRRKLATLSRVRHISSSSRARHRSNLFHSASKNSRQKLAKSKNVLGVRRRATEQTPELEPNTKQQLLSGASTLNEQSNDICAEKGSHSSIADVDDGHKVESSGVNCDTSNHTADALSLITNYNSASSSNDSE